MTDLKETLYQVMDSMRVVYGERPRGNLRFAILHEDGVVSSFPYYVCWAPVRNLHVWDGEYERNDEDLARNGYVQSEANIDQIIIHFWGSVDTPCDPGNTEYSRAIHAWCELYKIGLVEASPEEREEHGIIVDVSGGRLTMDQLGAFLVGFRNMSEQGRFRLWNVLIDAGCKPHRAAFFNQMFTIDHKDRLTPSRGYHTIFGGSRMYNPRVSVLDSLLDTNPWFTISADQPVIQHEGGMNWEFSNKWPGSIYDNIPEEERLLHTLSLEKQYENKGTFQEYTYFIPSHLINKLKELNYV